MAEALRKSEASRDEIPAAAKVMRDRLYGLREKIAQMHVQYLGTFVIATLVLTSCTYTALWLFYPHVDAIFALAIMLPLLISFGIFHLADKAYRKKVRQLLIDTLTVSGGYIWKANGHVKIADVKAHSLLPTVDSSAANDGFEGSYNNASLTLQDIGFVRKGMKRPMLAARFRLKRPVDGHTVILSQMATKTLFKDRFANYGKVGTPGGKFDRQMDIFSTERSEAKLLVDAAFMERAMEASGILRARWSGISFMGSEILFLFERGRPLLDPPRLWSGVSIKTVHSIYEQFEIFFKTIDVLRSNRQIALS